MLSIFPSLLIFGIFAPFILRVVVGVYFFYTGYKHLQVERENIVKEVARKIGTFAKPLVILTILIEVVIGLSLIAGFLTQPMALVGILYILILLWFKNECPIFVKHERVFYIILFAILLSLLLTGAGALAVDLPL